MDCDREKLLSYSLKILNRKDYTTSEIREKLLKRCDDEILVRDIISKLISLDLLNDRRYVENYIGFKVERGWGPEKIKYELIRRGILESEIEKSLKEKYPQQLIKENIERNLKNWIRKNGEISDRKKLDRLFKYLFRLGFDTQDILDILSNFSFHQE